MRTEQNTEASTQATQIRLSLETNKPQHVEDEEETKARDTNKWRKMTQIFSYVIIESVWSSDYTVFTMVSNEISERKQIKCEWHNTDRN